jgi:hypothetical protein
MFLGVALFMKAGSAIRHRVSRFLVPRPRDTWANLCWHAGSVKERRMAIAALKPREGQQNLARRRESPCENLVG